MKIFLKRRQIGILKQDVGSDLSARYVPCAEMNKYEKQKDREYLKMHNRSIWQGKDGDFYTKVKGADGKYRLRHATTREALEKRIIALYKHLTEKPTVRDVFEEWLLFRRPRLPKTIFRKVIVNDEEQIFTDEEIQKTYASILWDAGVLTEKAIIKQMGHVDAQVTREHYYYSRGSEDNVEKSNSIFKPMVNQVKQEPPKEKPAKKKDRGFESR